jgi:hypothetical protein
MLTPAPVQSTYQQFANIGQVGMPASMSGWDVDTRIAEAASADGIGFGLAVSQSAITDRGAVIGLLSGGTFVGITCADPTLPNVTPGFTDLYQEGDNMAVAIRGDWWVVVTGNIAAGSDVYFNSVTGALGPSTISNAVKIDNAKWMTTIPYTTQLITLGNMGVVRLNGIFTS